MYLDFYINILPDQFISLLHLLKDKKDNKIKALLIENQTHTAIKDFSQGKYLN